MATAGPCPEGGRRSGTRAMHVAWLIVALAVVLQGSVSAQRVDMDSEIFFADGHPCIPAPWTENDALTSNIVVTGVADAGALDRLVRLAEVRDLTLVRHRVVAGHVVGILRPQHDDHYVEGKGEDASEHIWRVPREVKAAHGHGGVLAHAVAPDATGPLGWRVSARYAARFAEQQHERREQGESDGEMRRDPRSVLETLVARVESVRDEAVTHGFDTTRADVVRHLVRRIVPREDDEDSCILPFPFEDTFSDPLFEGQWYLGEAEAGTVGINARRAWEAFGATGCGVVVSIVDDGLDYEHPDIIDQFSADASYDFNCNKADVYPNPCGTTLTGRTIDVHGTASAGVVGARIHNDVCGAGVAYDASMAGVRILSSILSASRTAEAIAFRRDLVDIYSNSWGPSDTSTELIGPEPVEKLALVDVAVNGRGGRGGIVVWAGGNGLSSSDNVNYDGYANSEYTIAVGAVRRAGTATSYGEPGSPLLIVMPSSGSSRSPDWTESITSIDLRGPYGHGTGSCRGDFGGTSAACPMAAGVVAAMLSVAPRLTWRDVPFILAKTASREFLGDGTTYDVAWQVNGAGMHFSHTYGFGIADMYAAVDLSRTWRSIGGGERDRVSLSPEASTELPLSLLYTVAPGFEGSSLESYREGDAGVELQFVMPSAMVVEWIDVSLEMEHVQSNSVHLELFSPSGTRAILSRQHNRRGTDVSSSWKYGAVTFLGEEAQGTWSLFAFVKASALSRLLDASLTLAGTRLDACNRCMGGTGPGYGPYCAIGCDGVLGSGVAEGCPDALRRDGCTVRTDYPACDITPDADGSDDPAHARFFDVCGVCRGDNRSCAVVLDRPFGFCDGRTPEVDPECGGTPVDGNGGGSSQNGTAGEEEDSFVSEAARQGVLMALTVILATGGLVFVGLRLYRNRVSDAATSQYRTLAGVRVGSSLVLDDIVHDEGDEVAGGKDECSDEEEG